jgi:hypothetical protein
MILFFNILQLFKVLILITLYYMTSAKLNNNYLAINFFDIMNRIRKTLKIVSVLFNAIDPKIEEH